MSMPPQGGWPPPQPGPQPPNQPQYGPPQGYQPYPGQQPYPPQGQWQQPPPPPQKSGGATKWLLVAIAVLLVIGVTIGATLLFTRDGDGSSTPPTSDVPSDIASANDTGPVSIITEEPTCEAFNAINNGLADIESNGWADVRNDLGPSPEWTPAQRAQVDAVATAMRRAADQAIALAAQTPHRLVRRIYEQFIASGTSYASSVQDYRPIDNELASINIDASGAITGLCNVIELGASGRSLSLPEAQAPTGIETVPDPANSKLIASPDNALCNEWVQSLDVFVVRSTPQWQNRDGDIPGSEWPPERRALEQRVRSELATLSDSMVSAGRSSGDSIFEDLATAASLYINAYIAAGDMYTKPDGWLIYTGFQIANLVAAACRFDSG